jgi:4,5-dihydroxyphthalate decarboxylase
VHRVAALPDNLADDDRYDAAEMSFSRYSLGRARGEAGVVGVPHFLMRAFRLRCVITSKSGGLTKLSQLAGRRIGLAGWQDSGNTWTRALLRREGVDIDDAQWRISRLTESHPIMDRVGGYAQPGLIETVADGTPLLDLLARGELDAVFMPFMPPAFFDAASPFRQLVPEFRRAELEYFRDVGYVPGIHLLALKASVVAANPWLPQALSEVIDASYRSWMERRLRYAETTPWLLDELRQVAQDLPAGWDLNGFQTNRRMIAAFGVELRQQNLTEVLLTPEMLFPQAAGQMIG